MRHVLPILFTLFLLLIACEEEEVFDATNAIEEHAANDHPTINYLTLDDIDPAVMKQSGFNKLVHKTNAASRSITTNFGTVQTDQIMQTVSGDGIENYTFLVSVDDNNPKEFYNLIIRKRRDGSYADPYVKKYTMTDAFFEEYVETGSLEGFTGHFINIDVSGFINPKDLLGAAGSSRCPPNPVDPDDTNPNPGDPSPGSGGGTGSRNGGPHGPGNPGTGNDGGSQGGTPVSCVSRIVVVPCNWSDHHTDPNDPDCKADQKAATYLRVTCSDGSSVEVQLNKGVSTSVGCPDDDGPVGILYPQLDPTKELNKLFAQTKFRLALANLRQAANDNKDSEEGYEVRQQNGVIDTKPKAGQFGHVNLAHGGTVIGGMHMHTKNGDPMFSEHDIKKLLYYFLANKATNKNPSTMFSILVTPNGTYAMTIKNITMLRSLVNTVGIKKLGKRLKEKYNVKKNTGNISTAYLNDITNALNELYAEYGMPDKALNIYRLNTEGNAFEIY